MKRNFIAKEVLVNGQMAPVGIPTLMIRNQHPLVESHYNLLSFVLRKIEVDFLPISAFGYPFDELIQDPLVIHVDLQLPGTA
jgi:hypothetical protein